MINILLFAQIPRSIGGLEIYIQNLAKHLHNNAIQTQIIFEVEKSGFYHNHFSRNPIIL